MLFELDWMGGAAARMFRKHRGTRLDEIDFGGVDTVGLLACELDRLRIVWTQSAHQEWCAAGAFNAILTALLQARAPVDVIGMAGRFVADEMVHVELAARMANAYGGGVALAYDPLAITPVDDGFGSPIERACAMAVRVSCVGETFSLGLIGREWVRSNDAVARAVLGRLAVDEAPHALLGSVILQWALPRLGAGFAQQLGPVADDAVAALKPAVDADPANRQVYQKLLDDKVRTPLARLGVPVTASL